MMNIKENIHEESILQWLYSTENVDNAQHQKDLGIDHVMIRKLNY